MEIDSPVPCETGIWTGIRNWASGWHNKLRARIIPRMNPRKQFHSCDPTLSPLFVHHTRAPGPQMETTYGGRKRKYFGVKIRDIGI